MDPTILWIKVQIVSWLFAPLCRSRSSHPGSMESISAKPQVGGPHLSLRLIWQHVFDDMGHSAKYFASIGSPGIVREKFLIPRRRNACCQSPSYVIATIFDSTGIHRRSYCAIQKMFMTLP
jgi:hypothetical protein